MKKIKKTRTRKHPYSEYFQIGDDILMGKYKNSRGKIVGFGEDERGHPTVEIEPVPKGRKKNKIITLFRIWRDDKTKPTLK